MAGVLNLCFSIFKEFLLSAPFFRGLRRLDFRKIGEKSFTKLWALDCWFSRTKSSAFFALKKGAGIGGMNMSKEQTAKKERFLREVERQLLRKGLDSEMTEGGIHNVKWHGQLLCDVDGDGVENICRSLHALPH